jgi:hypothetical protein
MTKRKTHTRGYLSQLAEPLLPSETVLAVQHGAQSHAGTERSLVPTVEDRFIAAEDSHAPWSPPTLEPSRESPAARHDQPSLQPLLSEGVATANPSPRQETAVVASTKKPSVPTLASERRSLQPEGDRNEITGAAATARPKHEPRSAPRKKRETPLVSFTVASEGAGTAMDLGVHAERIHAQSPLAAEDPRRPRTEREVDRRAEAPRSLLNGNQANTQSDPHGAAATHEPPRQPAVEKQAAPSGVAAGQAKRELLAGVAASSDSRAREETRGGARVHIGTIEIRAVLPPSSTTRPAIVAPVQAYENRSAQSRVPAGAAEPLVRGLSWSYGLVQG